MGASYEEQKIRNTEFQIQVMKASSRTCSQSSKSQQGKESVWFAAALRSGDTAGGKRRAHLVLGATFLVMRGFFLMLVLA